jgi:peptidoglycan hydrolase-like protein with peptidoglycan-binding domain
LGSAVTSAPYTTSWNTSSSSNGTHTLSTLATDTNLNTATSSPITVTVNNATGGGGGGGGQTGVTVDVGSGYSVGYPPGYVFNSSSTSSATIPTNSSTTQPGGGNASSIAAAIASLEAQLQTLLKEAGQGTGGGSAPYPFTRNLELHDQGSDVAALQEFLIQENTGPAARALKAHGVTQHFGTLTYNALKEYQASVGLPATGFFGALTRKEMEGRW